MCMFSTAAAGCGVPGENVGARERSGAHLEDVHLFSCVEQEWCFKCLCHLIGSVLRLQNWQKDLDEHMRSRSITQINSNWATGRFGHVGLGQLCKKQLMNAYGAVD